MNDNNAIFLWLDHLRHLVSVSHLIFVGAGSGGGPWVRYLSSRKFDGVTLIEADKNKMQHLQRSTSMASGWQLKHQLISPDSGASVFYQASLSSESGIINPEGLRGLWPNIKICKQQNLIANSLEQAMQESPCPANWVLIDCLPAGAILESAGSYLEGIKVVIARVLLCEPAFCGGKADLASIQKFLGPRHFRLLTVERGRHPGFGYALFVSDFESLSNELTSRLTERAREVADLEAEVEKLQHRIKLQSAEVRNIKTQIGIIEATLMQ